MSGSEDSLKGLVFDIGRFSVHDGPGIRTAVFLKGCPLRCGWCQNPEGLIFERRLCYFQNKCIKCGACIKACAREALAAQATDPVCGRAKPKIRIERSLCDLCGDCTDVCPPQALAFDSRWMGSDELLSETLKDKAFYRETGGVTLTGGDPLFQAKFSLSFLRRCRENGLRTAMETSLFTERSVMAEYLPLLDLLIADIKLFDPVLHKRYTGRDNAVIKENLTFAAENQFKNGGCPVLVRVPLIPGFTATEENLKQIGAFLYSLHPDIKTELINYNPLAYSKYILMNQPFIYDKNPDLYSKDEVDRFYGILADAGLHDFASCM